MRSLHVKSGIRRSTGLRGNQGGVVLIEAMIGILIFSLGVLALVAMQAVSTSNVSNARYRSEAAFLANEIAAQAWIARGTGSNIATFKWPGGNPTTTAWVQKVETLLPQAAAYPPTITSVAGDASGYILTITVRWKAPDALTPSNHVAVAYVTMAE
jgi:type IV pilus assembly protein PilV